MAIDVIMPKLGLTMFEGKIIKWHKSEGDYVNEGDVILELESDKSVNEEVARQSGYLLKTFYEEGDVVPILTRIAVIGEKGEEIPEEPKAEVKTAVPAPVDAPVPEVKPEANAQPATPAPAAGGRIIASPLARKVAKQLGMDLSKVVMPAGRRRITVKDVEDHAATLDHRATSIVSREAQRVPMSGMRKTIAQRMHDSLQTNAQTSHRVTVDMNQVAEMRAQLKKSGRKVSYNDIIAYATCKALTEFPAINAELSGNEIIQKPFVNLGVAVALDSGLIVPVLRDADRKNLMELSAAIREKGEAARSGRLSPDDYQGGSFTLSNLGMYGLDDFVAIINPPEAGILAVGAVRETPAVVDGALCVRLQMTLTFSYDHRIVDGAPAAQFLMRIKELLEHPYLLL